MKVVLDTNRYTDFMQGVRDVVAKVTSADAVYLPLIVLGELRAGFYRGAKASDNERILTEFLVEPAVEVLSPDEQTTRLYGQLDAQLRSQRLPISTNDLWIAALVIQHGLVLYSRDAHFRRIPQLPLV